MRSKYPVEIKKEYQVSLFYFELIIHISKYLTCTFQFPEIVNRQPNVYR
jgi:hypothetical protein